MKFYDFALREGKYGVWLYVKVDNRCWNGKNRYCMCVGYHRVVVAILSKSRGWSILSYSQSYMYYFVLDVVLIFHQS